MQNLEAYRQVAHAKTKKWMVQTEQAGNTELHEQAKQLEEQNRAAGESEYVWIDAETYQSIANALGSKSKGGRRMPLPSLDSQQQPPLPAP